MPAPHRTPRPHVGAPWPSRTSAKGSLRAATLALLLGAALAPTAPAAAETTTPEPPSSPAPVYPTADPEAPPAEEDEPLVFPGRTAESEHLFLSVADALEPRVDAAAVTSALEATDHHGAQLYLGVDGEPSSSSSAAQLVRGLLLFGETDALADDWLENGRRLGFVGDDWIVIGVIVPAEPGVPADVSIDMGRNMDVVADGGLEAIEAAGAEDFAAGRYTEALTRLAVAAGTGIQPRFDARPMLAGAGVVLGAGLLGYWLVGVRRRSRADAVRSAERRGAALRGGIRAGAGRLREIAQRPPGPVPAIPSATPGDAEAPRDAAIRRDAATAGDAATAPAPGTFHAADEVPASVRLARVLDGLAERADTELRRAVELDVGDVESLTAIRERVDAQVAALEGVLVLERGGPAARQAWERQFSAHAERLRLAADGLAVPGARALASAHELLAATVGHTTALDGLREEARRIASRLNRAGPYGLLDRVDALRAELDAAFAAFTADAAGARIALPEEVQAQGRGIGFAAEGRRPAEHDVVGLLALAAAAAAAGAPGPASAGSSAAQATSESGPAERTESAARSRKEGRA
ncbi:hypothetical protein ACQ3I4_08965 [Zafaria sp. Z1313]|uniref:hypothetical protein n=1 Tax=Zafaria sp. Z1313 TaxID=3423202 RepID=UPI003D302ACF